jgi:hypothetical protein
LIKAHLDRLTGTERQADEELSRQETAVNKTAEHIWRRYEFVIFGDACMTTLPPRHRMPGCRVVIVFAVDAVSRGASGYADEVRYAQAVGSRMRTSR